MAKKKAGSQSEMLSQAIVQGMQEKKASDIVILDLRMAKNAVADFFVICSGNSARQLSAIADAIDEMVSKTLNENPWHIEGKNNKEWVLLDYITVVAHVFQNERRSYYTLENLWGDAKITSIEN
ncbi:MAG TPA: ribosome silencing factor [Cyclobacteriaceae bacterium]|jgi:ribosome-associated protein|nr:ribosome silencing factor [Cyclobacteriaceae bacterium]HRK53496.1 ribosome silencing factor [Cyclobacteriaceae bacterium]